MEVGLAFGILPTDDRISNMDEYVLEYMYEYISSKEDALFTKLEETLGINWTADQARRLISKKGSSMLPKSVRFPFALVAGGQEFVDTLKATFGLTGKENYSQDAHTASLIGGKIINAKNVSIVEIDESVSKEDAKKFFEAANRSVPKQPESKGSVNMEPRTSYNRLDKGMQEQLDKALGG